MDIDGKVLKRYTDGDVDYARTVVYSTNAVTETIDEFTPDTDTVYYIECKVVGIKDDYSEGAVYHFYGMFVNDGGTVTLIQRVIYTHRQSDNTDWECEFALASPVVSVEVTGDTGDVVYWKCERKATLMEEEDYVH